MNSFINVKNFHVRAYSSNSSLVFFQLKGIERLSALFTFEIELASTNFNIDVRELLGTFLTVEIETVSLGTRYLNGVVTDFELLGRQQATSEYYLYKAIVRPSLWYLTQSQDYRIFQEQAVPDILKTVLGEYDFVVDYRLNSSYRNWEYCVQYEESDFNFVSRLMEHEGMYYWFEHADGQHTLVISDDKEVHQPYGGYETLIYLDEQTNVGTDKERVFDWEHCAEITSSKYSTIDYDFRKPNVKLDASQSHSVAGDRDGSEHYEWQAGYQELDHGDHYSRIRLEELKVPQEMTQGRTTARGLCPGYTFNLINHPRHVENQQYLCLAVIYDISVAGYNTGTDQEDGFEIDFKAIPADIQYRASRLTPKPKTAGPQTAQVVGPAGEEIWTDKYGRIKVQFHWDRDGNYDENSSCWVRVSSPWAGGGFGGLQLPRINDEVVVDFIGGNPDRPIVLGRVYNEMNMPPVELPAEAHTSGFRTQSVYGDRSTENHLLFIDDLGKEVVDLYSHYDMLFSIFNDLNITVHNLLDTDVGVDETRTVGGARTTTIGQRDEETFSEGLISKINGGRESLITGTVKDRITGEVDYRQTGSRVIEINGPRTLTIEGMDTQTITEDATWTKNDTFTRNIKDDWTFKVEQGVISNFNDGVTSTIKNDFATTVTQGRRLTLEGAPFELIVNKPVMMTAPESTFTSKTKLNFKANSLSVRGGTVDFKADSGDINFKGWILSYFTLLYDNNGPAGATTNGLVISGVVVDSKRTIKSEQYRLAKFDIGFAKLDWAIFSVKISGADFSKKAIVDKVRGFFSIL